MLRHRLAVTISAASILTLAVAGCGGTTKKNSSDAGAGAQPPASATPKPRRRTGWKLANLRRQLNTPYSEVKTSGGEPRVKELKGEYKKAGPNEAPASSRSPTSTR